MTLVVVDYIAQDLEGDALNGASVTVRAGHTPGAGTLADIFSDASGTPLANPFSSTATGTARFWVQPGKYNLTASGATSSVLIDVSDPKGYATVAALFADIDAGYTAPDGTVVSAGPVQFMALSGANVTGLRAGWVPFGEVEFEHFGVVGGVTTSQATALQNAINYCQTEGVRLTGKNGPYYIASTLTISKAFHFYMPFYADTTASNPADSVTNSLVWLASGGAAKMLVVKSATSGARLKFGRIDGVFDANNTATHCIHGSSWDNFTIGDVITYRPTVVGTLLDDGNSALLNNPIIDRLIHFCGANALAHNADGLVIDGDTTGFFATQAQVREYFGEYVNGDALTIRGIDNCTFGNVMPQERSGAGGTGYGIRIAKSVNFTSFHAQKNMFVHIGRGSVFVEDNTLYQRCLFMNGEATSVIFESDPGTAGRGTFWYSVGDRNSGAYYEDRVPYRLLDIFEMPVGDAFAFVGSPEMLTFGGFGVRAMAFGSGVTETIVFPPTKPQIDIGDVIGVEICVTQAGAGSGDVVWQIEMISRADGVGFGSSETTEQFTQTMNGTGSSANTLTHTLTTPLAVDRDDMLCAKISRLGADAGDTFPNDAGLLTMKLIYKTDGPNAPGSGPYQVTDLRV